jgi:archaeal flagellar protein FlaJ
MENETEKQKKSSKKQKKDKSDFLKEVKIAYRALEDPKKFKTSVLYPLIGMGVLVFFTPFLLQIAIPIPLQFNPVLFIIGGIIPIMLGIFYPFIAWKNKEADINGKIHFFITHLRVLAISDTSLKEIINMLGGNPAYGSLGEELRKISVLSSQWRMPLAKTFLFISKRTPSKILGDFLDRFSQSLDSGVEHREFIETEQEAVLEEYKTMYEATNENINILSEVYVSLLISIIFIMALGIVLPMIIGAEDMNTFIMISSFLLIVSEAMLLYLMKSMLPPDDVWHKTGEKGELELSLDKYLKLSILTCVGLFAVLLFLKYYLSLFIFDLIAFELIIAFSLSPLLIIGFKVFKAEQQIARKERNFLGFLPALGSISTMRGGRINPSVHYLSEKDYGVLTKHITDLYRRLRTRINDDASWEWFGVDTGSNHIQRSCEMFRQATNAAANPRTTARMISENIRKIRDLRIKKLSIINTTSALFAGITFGIAFSVYISLIIARHLNTIMLESLADRPFEGTTIDVGAILSTINPDLFINYFVIIFFVLLLHCFMLALTIRTLRGSHLYITFLYFVPLMWIVAVTAVGVEVYLGGYLGM